MQLHGAYGLLESQSEPVIRIRRIVDAILVADEAVPLWRKTEEELDAMGLPPPYWAFAWAGGQALARYVLDHTDLVAGKQFATIDFSPTDIAQFHLLASSAPYTITVTDLTLTVDGIQNTSVFRAIPHRLSTKRVAH